MAVKKVVLGRGLGALIEDSTITREIVQAVEANNEIELSLIDVNPFQPRQNFDKESLQELADSVKHLGIVQPVTLRKLDNGRYQIIAGERRLRAARMAGLERIPAYIRSTDDQGMLELALVENIHRTDLNAMEIAISYQRLVDECSLTQESISERVGKKRATISNYLRLNKLPAEIQLGIRSEQLSMGHARALITIDDPEIQIEIFNKVVKEELSVREVEDLVRTLNEPQSKDEPQARKKSGDNSQQSQDYEGLRMQLSRHFNTNVEFKRNDKGAGKIIIPFKTDEELERIISVFDRKQDS
jgi:ParB family transcriptional regulator, chromosome partitioning protein